MQFLHSSIAGPAIVQLQHLSHVWANETNDSHMRHLNMAYATDTSALRHGALADRLSALIIDIRARLARRSVFKTTYRELSALSDRELNDLGLNRTEIRRIAWEAAYEV